MPLTPEIVSRDGSLTRGLKGIPNSNNRLASWLMDIGPRLEKIQQDTTAIELNIGRLNHYLESVESLGSFTSNAPSGDSEVSYKNNIFSN